MEFIIVLAGILSLSIFTFLLIEYPYYLVSIFAFLHLYNINIELPGPLDMRGLISISLILRLLFFDKNNLDLIRESISNKFFILIILFTLYSSLVYFFTGSSLLVIVRLVVLNFTALILGFLTIYHGYGKKTIVLAFLLAGIISIGDLLNSYLLVGKLMIVRLVDYIWETNLSFNHNFFGNLCGEALIITTLLLLYKQIKKITAFALLITFSLGVVISTSRMTFLAMTATLLLIFFTQREININFKKIFAFGFIGIVLIFLVIFSFSFILSAMNIESKFADELSFRLIEEPLSFFNEDYQKFGWDNNKVQGSMRWRIDQTIRDAGEFFKQKNSVVFFGLGSEGYSEIGLIQYIKQGLAWQYSSHNFYINTIIEIGIVGLLLFLLFFISLLYHGIKMIKMGKLGFSFVYLILYMFIYSFGGNVELTNKEGYLLFGAIIAEFMLAEYTKYKQNDVSFVKNLNESKLIAIEK